MTATTTTAPTATRPRLAPNKRLLIGLTGCLLATGVFMLAGLSGNLGFVLELRGRKLTAMVLVGWATGVATVAFQTVTNNRLLTPSIMGLDALYIFIQSVLVFVLGVALVGRVGTYPMFFLNVGLMLLAASALTAVLFGKRSRTVYVVVLAGLVLGAVLRSLSSLIARMLDPSSFMVLQDNLFASFTAVNPQLIWVCAVIVALASWYLWSLRATLDVLTLGKDAAVSLGVPYRSTMRRVLLTTLRRAADELNKTIVIVVHDINYASCWANQIVAMKNGVIRAVGSPRQIMNRPLLKEVFDLDIEVIELRGHPIAHFYLPVPICANCNSSNEACCLERRSVSLGLPSLSA